MAPPGALHLRAGACLWNGHPAYRAAWRSEPDDGGKYPGEAQGQQDNVGEDFQRYVPVTIDPGNQVARVRVKVTGPTTEMELPLVSSKPKAVRFSDLDGVLAEVKLAEW